MTRFSKINLSFTINFNFYEGQFYKEVSKFGYFKKWKQVRTK